MCLVAWPLNESEAGVDLVLIETSLLFLLKFMRTASFTYDTEETILEASWNWSIQKKPSVESDLNWNPVHIQMFVRRVTDIMLFAPKPARFPKDILSHTHQDINLIIQGLTSAKTRELVFPFSAPARRTKYSRFGLFYTWPRSRHIISLHLIIAQFINIACLALIFADTLGP